MDTLILENQAWVLFQRIYRLYEIECVGRASRSIGSVRRERLFHARLRAYKRFQRRQKNHFNYHPGGFAPSPVPSSGVFGQGALS